MKCKECGKKCGNAAGFAAHMRFHARKKSRAVAVPAAVVRESREVGKEKLLKLVANLIRLLPDDVLLDMIQVPE